MYIIYIYTYHIYIVDKRIKNPGLWFLTHVGLRVF